MKQDQSVMKRLSSRSFKNSKGRNRVAIFAIALTTLMFTALFVLTQSMEGNMRQMLFWQSGYDAHASFKSITDAEIEQLAASPDIKEVGRSIVVSLAENPALSGRQVEIRYGDESYASHSFAAPTTGRMPEGMDEIALDDITLNRLGIPREVGQQVTIEWRADFSVEERTKTTFTLCGFWEGNASS